MTRPSPARRSTSHCCGTLEGSTLLCLEESRVCMMCKFALTQHDCSVSIRRNELYHTYHGMTCTVTSSECPRIRSQSAWLRMSPCLLVGCPVWRHGGALHGGGTCVWRELPATWSSVLFLRRGFHRDAWWTPPDSHRERDIRGPWRSGQGGPSSPAAWWFQARWDLCSPGWWGRSLLEGGLDDQATRIEFLWCYMEVVTQIGI